MNKTQLLELGLTENDVLDRIVEKLFSHYVGDDEEYRSAFEQRMQVAIKAKVEERLNAVMESHVLPNITAMVENLCLEETNKWGEKKGTKLTFTEYLVQRADNYIREEVDYNGKSKPEESYNWSKHSTRITFLIRDHLQYSIKNAMEKALGDVNSTVRKGLEEAVMLALKGIKVTVDTKVSSP